MRDLLLQFQKGHFQRVLDKQELSLQVFGYSMWPFLSPASTLMIKKVAWDQIRLGDIVLGSHQDNFVCHRVCSKNDKELITKADARLKKDPAFKKENIIGKVVAVKRRGRIIPLDTKASRWKNIFFLIFSYLTAPLICAYLGINERIGRFLRKTSDKAKAQELILQILSLRPHRNIQASYFSRISWYVFLKEVIREGLSGIVYFHLKQKKISHQFPHWVIERLHDQYMTNAGHNILMLNEFKDITAALEKGEVASLAVRGPAFLERMYSDLGQRSMNDIDFIIRDKDFVKTAKILEELGFNSHWSHPTLFEWEGVKIDIHLNSTREDRIPFPSSLSIANLEVYDNSFKIRQGQFVRVLNTYDMVLHSCEHLQKESFSKLKWFYDIALMIKEKQDTFDWLVFVQRAQKFNLTKSAYYALSFLKRHYLLDVPTDALDALKPPTLSFFEKRSLECLWNNQRSSISGDLLFWCMLPSKYSRWKLLRQLAFAQKEFLVASRVKIALWERFRVNLRFFSENLWKMIRLIFSF